MSTMNDIGVGLLGFTGALNQGMDRALRQRMFELQARGMDRQEALARSQIELEQQKIKQQQAEFGIAQDFIRSMQPGLLGAPQAPQVAPQVTPQVSTGGSGWNANNPGNIRPVGGQGFNTYATPEDGARAMSDLLSTYGTKHGINTLVGLTSRWAPKGDGANDPTAYAQFLSKQVGGYPIDAPIDLTNPEFRAQLMRGMSRMETGREMPQDMAMRAVSSGVQMAQAGPRTATDAGGVPQQPQAPAMGNGVNPSQVQMALQYSMAPGKAGEMARGYLSANKAALDIQFARSPEYLSYLKQQEQAQNASLPFQPQNVQGAGQLEATKTGAAEGEKQLFKDMTEIRTGATAALKTKSLINEWEALDPASGPLTNFKVKLGALAQAFGVNIPDAIKEAGDLQTAQTLASSMVLPMIQSTTAFHTNFSNTDREFLMRTMLSPDALPEANKRLAGILRSQADAALEKFQHFGDAQDYKDYQARTKTWLEKQNAAIEERRSQLAAPKVDQQTGQSTAPPPPGGAVILKKRGM